MRPYSPGGASERGPGSWRPTVEQELLLRACLCTGDEALAAWNRWSAAVDIAKLDVGSQRLLPLLYRNLTELSVQHPWIGKLRGTYRATWFKNNLLFNAMAKILRSFHDAGIETMLLKGAAATLHYYRDYGLRPMSDVDILIPPQHAVKAVSLLADNGWDALVRRQAALIDAYFVDAHGCSFLNRDGLNLDLHGHFLEECCYPGADDDFWASSLPAEVHGVTTRTPDPADLLMHICVHGSKWDEIPTIRWVADAIRILKTAADGIDWNRLLVQARNRLLVLPLRESLTYLRDKHSATIPSFVIDDLNSLGTSEFDRDYNRLRSRIQGAWTRVPYHWHRYRRNCVLSGAYPSQAGVIGFAHYLQRIWAVKRLWHVPFMAVDATTRKIWHDRRRYFETLTRVLTGSW
jgi:hypothetical protein